MVGSISDREFDAVRKAAQQLTGQTPSRSKRAVFFARLKERLSRTGCQSINDYLGYLKKHDEEKSKFTQAMVNGRGGFFGDSHHFEYLRDMLLTPLLQGGAFKIRLWSAGCDTGEEAYSMAIMVREVIPEGVIDVKILASDSDPAALAYAEEGIYDDEMVREVPVRNRRWLEQLDKNYWQIKPELRQLVTFRNFNLASPPWNINTQFDGVFCKKATDLLPRNVIRSVYEEIEKLLKPEGMLFVGEQENLLWLPELFLLTGPTVYGKVGRTVSVEERVSGRMRRANNLSLSSGRVEIVLPREVMTSKKIVASRPLAERLSSRGLPVARKLTDSASRVSKVPSILPPLEEVEIRAGETWVSRTPAAIQTLVGTGVTVCLFDRELKVGGVGHLIKFPESGDFESGIGATNTAIDSLLMALEKMGAERSQFEAKLFCTQRLDGRIEPNGTANARSSAASAASARLQELGIPIVASRLDAIQPTILRFETHTGRAMLREVPAPADELTHARSEK